ncbi:Whole genome shotgun sequence [Vibrio owensii]|uniref:Whole genome shotgun sequence n=1 Tax=Vibrio owensii TaxID=696485 RepID=A0AAU9PYI9_9VIBR|nr:Whole genome shotgun sequence [Vibrio owensii]
MIGKFKGTSAWNAYMAYRGFVNFLYLTDYMRKEGIVERSKCLERFQSLSLDGKKELLINLMGYKRIDHYDMMALVSIHTNSHGMSIDHSSIDNYQVSELAELVLESLLHCSELKDAGLFF